MVGTEPGRARAPGRAAPPTVDGVRVLPPDSHADHRGRFRTVFCRTVPGRSPDGPDLVVEQVSHSVSARGVIRGVHYPRRAPGVAKIVHCLHGEVLDIAVDLRVGSPGFGRWMARTLTPDGPGLFLPPGVGHAFVALRDETLVHYLMSRAYDPTDELAVSVHDPRLALPLPTGLDLVLSDRDRVAPDLDTALAAGLLPLDSAMGTSAERDLP